ncbi:MAG: PHP domain-containing protein [Mycobacteriales bacterium]
MPRPAIDLHTHTTASDGTTPPELLVRAAADAGLDVLALTDHDTTAGWDRAADALPPGLSLVRGAELSCTRDGTSLHLLAYLFDPSYAPLADRMRALRESRVDRAAQMVRMLVADGHPVTWEQVQELADGTVGRPHVAQALVQAGLVATVADAFTPEWIGTSGRYWGAKLELDVLEAIALVAEAGGVTVFAHPGAASRGRTVGDDVIADMAAAGLAGLEVDHPDHPPEARAHLARLAGELGLLTTGASDFHGANKVVGLGDHRTAAGAYDELVARATGVEVL